MVGRLIVLSSTRGGQTAFQGRIGIYLYLSWRFRSWHFHNHLYPAVFRAIFVKVVTFSICNLQTTNTNKNCVKYLWDIDVLAINSVPEHWHWELVIATPYLVIWLFLIHHKGENMNEAENWRRYVSALKWLSGCAEGIAVISPSDQSYISDICNPVIRKLHEPPLPRAVTSAPLKVYSMWMTARLTLCVVLEKPVTGKS